MNKQALAFLTMFSLVLMLSVYYVTLPSDTAIVVNGEEKEEIVEETNAEENGEEISESQMLQKEIDAKKVEKINKNNEIVSQGDSQKTEAALKDIEVIKSQQKLQNEIIAALKEQSYDTSVEINDATCVITVFAQEDSADTAKKIMKSAHLLTNQKYFIEVAFK